LDVVTGVSFCWNVGLAPTGPFSMLVVLLVVCLLFLLWVLALSDLAVALPFAGGPLAYGRRAAGPALGFVMGWSMYLECQFATIATALATGGYIAFLMDPSHPSETVQVWSALITIVVFFVLHVWGVKEQSQAMGLMTYGAILGLVIFWALAATEFRLGRILTRPPFPRSKGGAGRRGRRAVCVVGARDHRNCAPGRRRSARAAPHDPARARLGPVDIDCTRRTDLALCLRRGRRLTATGRDA